MTCKREEKVDDGYQMSKGRGLSKWEAGSLFKYILREMRQKSVARQGFP